MPATSNLNDLSEMPLFHGLTPDQLAWLNDHQCRQVFPAGTHILTAEQRGEIVYIILEGTVKIHVEQ